MQCSQGQEWDYKWLSFDVWSISHETTFTPSSKLDRPSLLVFLGLIYIYIYKSESLPKKNIKGVGWGVAPDLEWYPHGPVLQHGWILQWASSSFWSISGVGDVSSQLWYRILWETHGLFGCWWVCVSLLPLSSLDISMLFKSWTPWVFLIAFCNLRVALALALRTLPLGLHIYAPDCSSWTRISRGSSLRNSLCAIGDLDKGWVRRANCMIARFLSCIV